MTNSLSRHSSQPPEDWDHPESVIDPSTVNTAAPAPSRIVFPSHGGGAAHDDNPQPSTPDPSLSHRGGRSGKRTLSELLKLHAEKGTNVHFTTEEAARLEEVLGQWVILPLLSSTSWLTLCFSCGICIYDRSTRARRRTKEKTSFLPRGPMMTRSCSCTARLHSTLLLDARCTVRARV